MTLKELINNLLKEGWDENLLKADPNIIVELKGEYRGRHELKKVHIDKNWFVVELS